MGEEVISNNINESCVYVPPVVELDNRNAIQLSIAEQMAHYDQVSVERIHTIVCFIIGIFFPFAWLRGFKHFKSNDSVLKPILSYPCFFLFEVGVFVVLSLMALVVGCLYGY
ncbi:hypothetical protein DLAC_06584 [Tieghemostelium lacteum]|uniref:Transmembrane protein n=1 Tax=Tieghemostelium lacteum TaxID=361077 RepID=A0A151ZF42_TIELA|nr:hypothetical protein DLAC_06584 [Tieghemostelium lacteum]|eukprot:KYQ92592.1 hypothetical protein DLAC_06584 [Tieghemostelium lacteum]